MFTRLREMGFFDQKSITPKECVKIVTNVDYKNYNKEGEFATNWSYMYNCEEIGYVRFWPKTGEFNCAVGPVHYSRYKSDNVNFVKDMLLDVIEEIKILHPNVNQIKENSCCVPEAWKAVGGTCYGDKIFDCVIDIKRS